MSYMGSQTWWNERFKTRSLHLLQHEHCLEEDLIHFPSKGKILDLACGDGRNAIYLAQLGYDVTAIDFSSEALNRLKYFIKDKDLQINCYLTDLSTSDAFSSLGLFDAIIINHYTLHHTFYPLLMEHLSLGGILWINGFNELSINHSHISSSDLLTYDDFNLMKDYKLLHQKYYEVDSKKFMRIIFKN